MKSVDQLMRLILDFPVKWLHYAIINMELIYHHEIYDD